MIKGLYFKLNMDNNEDSYIYKYFNKLSKTGMSKKDMLYSLIKITERYEKSWRLSDND